MSSREVKVVNVNKSYNFSDVTATRIQATVSRPNTTQHHGPKKLSDPYGNRKKKTKKPSPPPDTGPTPIAQMHTTSDEAAQHTQPGDET